MTTSSPPPPTYVASSWRALGTYVQLVVADESRADAARTLADELLAAVDLAYSRFRDDSDLVRINSGAGSWVTASGLMIEALEVAMAAAEETDGLVDPCLGHSLVAMGYDEDLAVVQRRPGTSTGIGTGTGIGSGTGPADLPTAIPARRGAWHEIEVRHASGEVRIPFDVALDLGATGKAFAADLIAHRIADDAGTDCVLSLGGDVAIGGSPDHAWQIAVSEAPDDEPAQQVTLRQGGLATSTTRVRTWVHGGREVHHLLDPRTGRPVERVWRTVSVMADSCVAANTASTAAIVLGESAPSWLSARSLAARMVARDGSVTPVGHWPASTTAGAETGTPPASQSAPATSLEATGAPSRERSV